jgi:ABC-type branched-subunit amino acid transport system ATPase component
VGVVGRTGSGKTTLLMALFRVFPLSYGRITLAGVNIASVPLAKASVLSLPDCTNVTLVWTGMNCYNSMTLAGISIVSVPLAEVGASVLCNDTMPQ